MRCRNVILVLLAAGLVALAAQAQVKLEEEPGYFPVERLGLLSRDRLSLEINLGGPLLKLVAAAEADDPEFVRIVSKLESVRVQVAPLEGLDEAALRTGIADAGRQLEGAGWAPIVRVRDGRDTTFIYARQAGEAIAGLVVLAIEADDEVVLINLVGNIDATDLAALAEGLSLPELHIDPRVDR